MEQIEFTDRYDAMGIERPNLRTVCRGDCEGTGVVPIYFPEADKREADGSQIRDESREVVRVQQEYVRAWMAADAVSPTDDGWHFVTCPACGGTGRTTGRVALARQFVWALGKKAEFARRHVLVRPYTSGTAALALRWQEQDALRLTVVERPVVEDMLGGVEVETVCPFPVAYGDRLDVPSPWLWNRRLALRVLFDRVR